MDTGKNRPSQNDPAELAKFEVSVKHIKLESTNQPTFKQTWFVLNFYIHIHNSVFYKYSAVQTEVYMVKVTMLLNPHGSYSVKSSIFYGMGKYNYDQM